MMTRKERSFMKKKDISVPEGALAADAAECVSHKGLPAVYECDKCGAPICDSCYDAFTLEDEGEEFHFCADCYKGFIAAEAEEAVSLKKMIVREFIGIAFGMVIGFILGLALGMDTNVLALQILLPILGTFVGGSFVTIVKKIYNSYQLNKDTSGGDSSWVFNLFTALFICAGYIIISPFTTIYRIVVRVQDRRALDEMLAQVAQVTNAVDEFVQRVAEAAAAAVAGSMALEAAASGADAGVEISLDDIAGEGFEIAENGEFLRKVRYR